MGAIVAILKDLTSSDLADQVCTDSDVSELDNKKTTSLAKAAEAVASETNKIAAATEEFNEAVALINTINEAGSINGGGSRDHCSRGNGDRRADRCCDHYSNRNSDDPQSKPVNNPGHKRVRVDELGSANNH